MNSFDEIRQAIADLETGKFGPVPGQSHSVVGRVEPTLRIARYESCRPLMRELVMTMPMLFVL